MQPPASTYMPKFPSIKIITYLICTILVSVHSSSPSFITSLTDCKSGSAVLTVSSPNTTNGFDTTYTTFTFPTSFTSTPNVALGHSYLSSTYSTTTSLYIWVMNVTVYTTTSSSAILLFNRTSGIISQISINYLAVLSSSFLEITTTHIDLTSTNLYSLTSDQSRSFAKNITYRTKSNSTNAVIGITTTGLHTIRQTVHTFAYTLAISGQYTYVYELTVTVAAYNKLAYISICGVSYELIATTISAPYYLSMGYLSDFSGTITETSGATGVTTMGTIFVGITQWTIDDSNGVHNYNFSLSANNYVLTSTSLLSCRNSYVWYRQQTCPQYYYLSSHNCIACDITCNTCDGTSSTNCLSCTSTRTYNAMTKTCTCLTGYVDQGSRDCTLVTCNTDLCRTCSNIDQCGSCYTFLYRQLSGTNCVCMKYRYDQYSLNSNPFCDACHYSCYTCTTNASTSCTSCNPSRDNRQYKSSNSTCACMSGYYDSSTTICAKCNYTCSTCALSSSCSSCNSTKGRVFDTSVTYCACTAGMYDDRLQQQCQTCKVSCQTCSDATTCSTCPSTRYLSNTTTANNQCVCMSGYYDNGINQQCSNCQYTCYTCINPTQCESCTSLMHRQYDATTKLCVCSTGYYDDLTNQLCADCHIMCLGCSTNGSTSCTSCDASSYRTLTLSGTCICMDGYYEYNNSTEMCASCYYTCAKCTNSYQCTSCNNLKFRTVDPTNSSKCICMPGYYDTSNQLCSGCPYYCLTCTNSSACATCDNTTRDITTGCSCRTGYYDDGVSNACQPCLSQCLTCTNPYNCTSCTPTIKYLTTTGQCKCSAGYLEPSCTPCSYQCQQCTTTSDNCVTCDGLSYRYYFYNNTTSKGDCLCYDGYYSDNVNALCKNCQYSCQTCTTSTACTSCPTNRQFDSLNQYCVCVGQYYQNSQSLSCLPCHYSCQNCSDYSICVQCNSAKFRILNAVTKLCNCDVGYYDDGQAQLCKPCAPQCKTCSAYITCLTCDLATKFRVINNATKRCPCTQSYYESTVDSLCHACHYSCLACIDDASCVACVAGRVIDVNTGLCKCADGTFENSTTLSCQICTYPCQTCITTASTCLSCQSTHTFLASTSSCYCRTGTYENTTQCVSCLSTCYQCANNNSCSSCRLSDNRYLQLIGSSNQCKCLASYQDQNSTVVICANCHYSCATCLNSVSCSTCNDIRIMLNGTNGYCSCPLERYYDVSPQPSCLPCSYLCLSCDKFSTNCTDCSSSAFRYKYVVDATVNSATCLCLNKYYSGAVGVEVCLACHYSCSTCTNSTNCLTCNSTMLRQLQSSVGTYCSCMTGYYDVTNIEQCQTCSYTCQTCSSTSSNCLSCPTTRNFTFNSCPCNDGLFDDMVSRNPTCSGCLYMCQTCSNSYSCLTCPATRASNSSNLCPCQTHYYDNGVDKLCASCSPSCSECSDLSTCTSCYETTQLRTLYNNACVCQTGYYDMTIATPGSTNYTCQLCQYSCLRCQNSLSCSSCDSTMSRVRNINSGYCKCADGYYDNGVDVQCQACPFDCLTCSNSTTCLTCPSQRDLDPTTQRCLCSSSTYTNGSLCQSCPPECASCTSYSVCTSCNNPTQRTLNSSSCLCNSKLYPVANTAQCGSCQYSCATCTSNTYCTTCSSTAHRYLTARQCKCLNSYFDDGTNEICQSCHYTCLTCTNATECSSCDTSSSVNRIYNTSSKYCSCNTGYYEDPSLKTCVACNYSCYTCSNPNSCSSCSPTTLRSLDSATTQCLCPAVGYFDRLAPNCATCDPTCYTCTTSSTYCTDCNYNVTFRILTATHTCVCQNGYFQSSSLTVICSTCSYKCLTCGAQSTTCTSCSTSNNRDNSTIPNCNCLQGFYDDGSTPACQLCDYRCLTCLDSFKCTGCDLPNDHRNLDLVSQMCKCSDRYYESANSASLRDPVCLGCHYTCLSCNHATLCQTCDLTNNTRVFSNGQCLCSTGFYDDGSNILCLACSYFCQTCTSASSCSTCNPLNNRFLNVTSGLCQCLRGYYDVNNGVDPVCYACQRSCYTCTNSTHCQTCYPLTNKYINTTEGTNYCICLYGYFQTVSTGVCSKCHYSCERCSGSSTSCTVCDSTAHRTLRSGSCPCDTSYYDDGRNEACLLCTTNCASCFGTNAGQCLKCMNGTYLLNGVCWNTCPDFYYPINSTWICESCSGYCRVCQISTTCQQCQSGFYLISSNLTDPNNTNLVCTSPCPEFYYHNTTACMKCISPCKHCSDLYVCLDCIETYFFENSTGSCYPCHPTCRFCTNSAAIGCISCIDGYFLNSTIRLCVKLTCSDSQYVNSMYGCYSCKDTYPNSLSCNAYGITTCSDGYMLKPNSVTGINECVRCDRITGYKYLTSTGLCEQICGDGIKFNDPCDDGNALNGDGCSSICSIQQYWQCNSSLAGSSTCTLSADAKPTITAESITKLSKSNKIEIVLALNIGLRLVKANFFLQFGNLQKFDYQVTALNSKYTRLKLTLEYFETVAKDKLSISVKSPIPSSSRLLQQISTPLTITLALDLQIQIITQPPALYYSAQNRSIYTDAIYIVLIVLHVLTLIIFSYFTFFLRLKTMLFTIELLNFTTLLYIYSTYGLYNVSELSSEAGRALQHFIYKFGEDLPEKYSQTKTSAGYFGFGGFMLAGCIIQVLILATCVLIKIFFGGHSSNLSVREREDRKNKYNIFRYYQLSFLYAFVPDLLLCCVIVFKWIEINNSVQSAYSWGMSIILLIIIIISNAMYIAYASPYARIIQKSMNKAIVNPLPFAVKEEQEQQIKVKPEIQVIDQERKGQQTSNFVTLQEAMQRNSEKEQRIKQDLNNNEFDPFAQESGEKQKLEDEQFSQKSETGKLNKGPKRSISRNDVPWQDENRTQAVIFEIDRASEKSQKNEKEDKMSQKYETTSQLSIRSKSTTLSQLKKMQLVNLYDLTPTEVQNSTLNLNISYYRIILHQSYLPFQSSFVPLLVCVVAQVQQSIPRCSMLIFAQLMAIVYIFASMRLRNTRTIKLLIMSFSLLVIAACGLTQSLITQLNSSTLWSSSTRKAIQSYFSVLQAVQISFILFGVVFNNILYVLESMKSAEYRNYKAEKKNKEILEKNLRKNRLRNINLESNDQINQSTSFYKFQLKNIFSNMRGNEEEYDRSRVETKQHLRMDSQNNTPAEYNNQNTHSNILIGMNSNKKIPENIQIEDIEDQNQYGTINEKTHKKFKSVLQKNKDLYRSGSANKLTKNRQRDTLKVGYQKELPLSSLEQISLPREEDANNLKSTRMNQSLPQKAINKTKKLQKEDSVEKNRHNDFLKMLQNQLNGDNPNDTAILVNLDQRHKKSNDLDKDNTLISYKQSLKSSDEKPKEEQQPSQKKKGTSIIKDLIPTREFEEAEDAVEGKAKQNKKPMIQQLEDDEQQNQPSFEQSQGDQEIINQSLDYGQILQKNKAKKVKKPEENVQRHYMYNLKTQKSKSKEKDPINKIRIKNQKKIKKQKDLSAEQNEEESQIPEVKQKPQAKIEHIELPRGIKNDGFEQKLIKPKKLKKYESYGVEQKLPEKKDKKRRVQRIDSISSIGEDIQMLGEQRMGRFRQSDEESHESEGVTVFKKILQDYQIYKNKRVPKRRF